MSRVRITLQVITVAKYVAE